MHPHSRLAIPISDRRGSSGIAGYINEMETQYEANAGCVGQDGAVGTRKEYMDWNACDVHIIYLFAFYYLKVTSNLTGLSRDMCRPPRSCRVTFLESGERL